MAFSLVLHVISTLTKYFNWDPCNKVKLFLADFINCKKVVDCLFSLICCISYCLCCKCYKEERKGEEENENQDNKDITGVGNNNYIVSNQNLNRREDIFQVEFKEYIQ